MKNIKIKLDEGFTLIEMMVTVVIIGLAIAMVVAIMMTNFKGNSEKAMAVEISEDIRSLNDAQLLYYAKFNKWGTKEEIMTSGILKSWPTPDERVADQACLTEKGIGFEYQYWYGEEGENDPDWVVTAVLPCVSEEFATIFNSLSAG